MEMAKSSSVIIRLSAILQLLLPPHIIKSPSPNPTTRLAHRLFFRSLSASHEACGDGDGGEMPNIRFPKRYLKKQEKYVAAQVLEHHLSHRIGLSLGDAQLISITAPAFIRKLLILAEQPAALAPPTSKGDQIRVRVEETLHRDALNEWECVLESIGIAPEKVSAYLPLLGKTLTSSHEAFVNIKILEELVFPRSKIGRVFEAANQKLVEFSSLKLKENVEKLEGMGVSRNQIGPTVLKYPEMLVLDVEELVKPFLRVLEELLVKRGVLGRLLMCDPKFVVENSGVLVERVQFLVKCQLTKDYIAKILRRNPEILLSDLMDQKLMLFSAGYPRI